MEFKVPSLIPQDLQLIQDIVGELPAPSHPITSPPKPSEHQDESDSILSSDNEDASSEKEVEADILGVPDEEEGSLPDGIPDSDSGSDSDSDSSEDDEDRSSSRVKLEDLPLEEEDGGGAITSPDQMKTKNEVSDISIVVPKEAEVGEHEVLEKVGEVMSIMDKVVIVKGTGSQVQNRAADRALDSDTLLVFEDRKVLGYIWETFGPTTQPFYRVQFNEAYPPDLEKIRLDRPVFHIPARSNFVFVSQIKHLKGSDASNAHDEEPSDDELDFSDDEAEREHKRALKERRGGSVAPSSRQATPNPSHLRDQEMGDDPYGTNPYDDAYNGMDYGDSPSRPPPVPYDDPYSDSYGLPEASTSNVPGVDDTNNVIQNRPERREQGERTRGHRHDGSRDSGRGRGRGSDRRRGGRGRGRGRGSGAHFNSAGHSPTTSQAPTEEYDPRIARPMSPTSMAIARATGQYSDGTVFSADQQTQGPPSHAPPAAADGYWPQYPAYPDPYNFNFAYPPVYVQPHINPRFASRFGMNFDYSQQQQ